MRGVNDEMSLFPLQDRVRLSRIRTFFDNARGNSISTFGAGLFFVLLLRSESAADRLSWVWLLLLFLLCASLFFFERHVKQSGLSQANATHFFRTRSLLGFALSVLLGASVVLLPEDASHAAYAVVFIIAASVVAAGYLAYATEFSYSLMVNTCVLLPFSILCIYRYLNAGDSFVLLLGLSSIFWQFIFVGKAFQVSRSVVGGIEIREHLQDEIAEREFSDKALKFSQEEAQRLAAMLRLMCDNVPDMIWAKDLEQRYIFSNKAHAVGLLNAENTEEPLGKTYDFFLQRERSRHPAEPDWYTLGEFSQDIDRYTLWREAPTVFEESGHVRGKFEYLDVHQARFLNTQGEVIGIVGSARDITERKASEAFVHHLAHHDVLTDLPNRILLTDRLRQALALARRDKGKVAVLFIDLDRLKPVNDTLGHDVGDLLLKAVANRLRDVVTRKADTVSRLGGDEFVVLLQRMNRDQDAATVAEKITSALSQPFMICRHEISISASIGIAVFPQHGEDVAQLLKSADSAMYSAKRAGRNGYRFFEETLERE